MIRTYELKRKTKETDIELNINIDGRGVCSVNTGIGFFDHMLNSLAFHAGFDIEVSVKGDLNVDGHHTVEDTGIVLGRAFKEAMGNMNGIERFAHAYVPMDEVLAFTALDMSGRPFFKYENPFPCENIGEYEWQLTEEFFRAFAFNAGITLNIKVIDGGNTHHMNEAVFKSVARALRQAVKVGSGGLPSTKGIF